MPALLTRIVMSPCASLALTKHASYPPPETYLPPSSFSHPELGLQVIALFFECHLRSPSEADIGPQAGQDIRNSGANAAQAARDHRMLACKWFLGEHVTADFPVLDIVQLSPLVGLEAMGRVNNKFPYTLIAIH